MIRYPHLPYPLHFFLRGFQQFQSHDPARLGLGGTCPLSPWLRYCIAAKRGPSHDHNLTGNMRRQFGEVLTCGFWDMRADGQTYCYVSKSRKRLNFVTVRPSVLSPDSWLTHSECQSLEHSNSRFESIRFDSLCESIRIDSFCKKIGLSIH